MKLFLLVLPLVACSSSNAGQQAMQLSCPMTIDELRAARADNNSGYAVDYAADFSTALSVCEANAASTSLIETFRPCGAPYDLMSWYSFPDCGEELVYDHMTGALVAVLAIQNQGGDACGGYSLCVAGPPQFVAPMPTNCPMATTCRP